MIFDLSEKSNKSVALRKESVDRNPALTRAAVNGISSLSARRAWIEMFTILAPQYGQYVALRKESVDRNFWMAMATQRGYESLSARRAWIEINFFMAGCLLKMSLSARRAWIEILLAAVLHDIIAVALRKESVDRNAVILVCVHPAARRSPQGERG